MSTNHGPTPSRLHPSVTEWRSTAPEGALRTTPVVIPDVPEVALVAIPALLLVAASIPLLRRFRVGAVLEGGGLAPSVSDAGRVWTVRAHASWAPQTI